MRRNSVLIGRTVGLAGLLAVPSTTRPTPPTSPSGDGNQVAFIGFRFPAVQSGRLAIRVVRREMHRPLSPLTVPVLTGSLDASTLSIVETGWVGAPRMSLEVDEPGSRSAAGAVLQARPHFASWEMDLAPAGADVLYVFADRLDPRSYYEVRLVDDNCTDLTQEACYSPPLVVPGDPASGGVSGETASGPPVYDIIAVLSEVAGDVTDTSGPAYHSGSVTYFLETAGRCNPSPNHECDDLVFCNGIEECVDGLCVPGSNPCRVGETCDETMDRCFVAPECVTDGDCTDGVYCNGNERCVSGACVDDVGPCTSEQVCDEATDRCLFIPDCISHSDCSDGVFCNGAEQCIAGSCAAAAAPCPSGQICDEANDRCAPAPECSIDSQCSDGLYCNGVERCVSGSCATGTAPCTSGQVCDEANDRCASTPQCSVDSHCSDDMFCNGTERCVSGSCVRGSFPCTSGQVCDETGDRCLGVVGCLGDAACSDGLFCNGAERCILGACVDWADPCTAIEVCDEAADRCMSETRCLRDLDCDDGVHCNGIERCVSGACAPGIFPCASGQLCDENNNICVNMPYQGYGARTTGGAGGDLYRVTSLADSGAGTLRDGVFNRSGPRTIVFDVAGAITLQTDIKLDQPYLTIDGSSAPLPGITIRKAGMYDGEFIVGGTHDIIIRDLRFWGEWESGDPTDNNAATITIDGDTGPDYVARNVVFDHITARGSADGGPDIWGEVRDVTISWCLFYYNRHPTTVSHYPSPYQVRQRISMHHNVFAKNGERQPQLRADVRDFDFRNNVIYDWAYFGSGYAVRIRNESGEPKVNANLINNYLLSTRNPSYALVYGDVPGPDSKDGGPGFIPTQGTVISSTQLGSLYVAGNILPPENRDHYSTIAGPLSLPSYAWVATYPASELAARVLPDVGMGFRTVEEQAIIDELAAAMGGTPVPQCTSNANCSDTLFCNGQESCVSGTCVPGANPCASGQTCDEAGDRCVTPTPSCSGDSQCSDGLFCNGLERCVSGACVSGGAPCTVGFRCVEASDTCEPLPAGTWVPPIGIPHPAFGITETVETMYGSSTYYTHYVDNSVACSDANNGGRGSATAPRCTIPTELPAGSVVVLRGGPYSYGTIDWLWTASGTPSQPVFIRGLTPDAMPIIRNQKIRLENCAYLVIENIHFDAVRISSSGANRGVSFRHNELRGRLGSNGMEIGGLDWVVFDNHIHDSGTWDPPDDRHGITVQSGSQRVWLVDNHIHHNSGDSIQFCHGCSTAPPRQVYVGGNVVHDDIENGVDIKYASDVVISQNTLYGYTPTSSGTTSSDGSAMVLGSDGGPDRVWVLFNEIRNSVNGIRNEATGTAWIVGNRIHHVSGFGLGLEKQAENLYFLFNTIYDADVAIDQFWREFFTLHIFNNVFVNMRGTKHGNHLNIELDTVARRSKMSNNVFWQGGAPVLIRWGSSYDPLTVDATTDFATFSGGAGNRFADPTFVNAAGYDFRLGAGSLAIDAAVIGLYDYVTAFCTLYGASFDDCRAELAVDAEGLPRPFGLLWDAGAHEWNGP